MIIRKATEQDFPQIQAIANVVWPATFGPLMSEETLHYMMDLMYSTPSLQRQINKENIKYLLIEDNDKAIGYSSYEIDYQKSGLLMVHRLYLLPSTQGSGYGTATLNHLSDLAKEKMQKGLCLKVLHSNDKAYQYYLKYGFKKTGEDYNHVGNNYPPFLDFILEKAL